jgi:hypothetical protein
VYLFCTFRGPVMYLGLLFRWSWPCPAAARRWSANRSHLHAARAWGRLCLARGRRFRPLPGGTALAALVRGEHAGCRAVCSRGSAARDRAVARAAARQSPGRRGNLPGTGSPATGRPGPGQPAHRPAPACPAAVAEGRRPGSRGLGRDGQQKWQTVYPGSRTCHRAAPPANTGTNTGTCRQRPPLSVADVQDTARINLPVHSQTDISVKLIKQSSVAGRRCVTYVNSRPPVRGIVSVH